MRKLSGNWKECFVSYDKQLEDGGSKRVKEVYVVDGITFGDAEASLLEELEPYTVAFQDLALDNINPASYGVIIDDADVNSDEIRYYNVRVAFLTVDEERGKEKRVREDFLVGACDFGSAKKMIDDTLKGGYADYEILKISESKVSGIFIKEP